MDAIAENLLMSDFKQKTASVKARLKQAFQNLYNRHLAVNF